MKKSYCKYISQLVLVLRKSINSELLFTCRKNATTKANAEAIKNDSISYIFLSLIIVAIQFVTGIISVDIFNYTGLKQATKIRIKYFESLIRQEIGWFDITEDTNLAVKVLE